MDSAIAPGTRLARSREGVADASRIHGPRPGGGVAALDRLERQSVRWA